MFSSGSSTGMIGGLDKQQPGGGLGARVDMDDVKSLLTNGELNAATASSAIECVCRQITQASSGSAEELDALEVLEQCSLEVDGAEALCTAAHGCEVLLTVAVRAQKQSAHQLSALASIANMSAACSKVRLMVCRFTLLYDPRT